MKAHRKSLKFEETAINLTPLIDVLFVVLIMFMIVAPLFEVDQVELATGSTQQSPSTLARNPIAIHVYADNSIAYNRQSVTLEQLKSHLQLAKQSFPNGQPHLYHDEKASFGTYQSVKNVVESVGFSELNVILKH